MSWPFWFELAEVPNPNSRRFFRSEGFQNRLDLTFQLRYVISGGLINTRPTHFKIVVHQHVPHAGDTSPGDLEISILQFLRKAPTCFADNLNVSKDV